MERTQNVGAEVVGAEEEDVERFGGGACVEGGEDGFVWFWC